MSLVKITYDLSYPSYTDEEVVGYVDDILDSGELSGEELTKSDLLILGFIRGLYEKRRS